MNGRTGVAGERTVMLDVSILGREFKVACKESERGELTEAVALLDRRMREIRDTGKVSGTDRIAVMAALNIAHELLSAKVGEDGFDVGKAKKRISSIEAKLDEAIAQQDKLF